MKADSTQRISSRVPEHSGENDAIAAPAKNALRSMLRDQGVDAFVTQVCRLAQADGLALAVRLGSEIVCVARAGAAPDIGVVVDENSGLTGKCLLTGKVVRHSAIAAPDAYGAITCVPLRQVPHAPGVLVAFDREANRLRNAESLLLIAASVAAEELHASGLAPVLKVVPLSTDSRTVLEHEGTVELPEGVMPLSSSSEAETLGSAPKSDFDGLRTALEAPVDDGVSTDRPDDSALHEQPTNSVASAQADLEDQKDAHLGLGAHRGGSSSLWRIFTVAAIVTICVLVAIGYRWRLSRVQPTQPVRAQTQLKPVDSTRLPRSSDGEIGELIRAAESGNPEAEYSLALKYTRGEGVELNTSKAAHWFSRSALAAHPAAQYEFGKALASGIGVPADLKSAYSWFIIARENGETRSEDAARDIARNMSPSDIADVRLKTGDMYANGEGTRADKIAAYAWYRLAEEAGNPKAKEAERAIAGKMSDEEIAAARDRADQWLQKHRTAKSK